MATILLAAAGASIGSGVGGTVLGLTGAVIGRAVGATVGRVIDQRLLGSGARAVETGRIDRLRLQSAGEGQPIARLWGQMRLPGHVIWASPVEEITHRHRAGKGAGPSVSEISYRMSFALALCEGPISGVGRVWADGEEVAAEDINLRVYLGDEAQMPDPVIAAREGEAAPAYRGIAYVVIEELGLERWGNRVPQLSFEVTRAASAPLGLSHDVEAVALIPGTGEYALATTEQRLNKGLGAWQVMNRATPAGGTDFQVSMGALGRELPKVGSVSMVVSWFGDDLRAGHCSIRPKVEQKAQDGEPMRWRAGGITRSEAQEIARKDDRPVYGGTPADGAVVEALHAIAASGRKAVFYPFILMEQQPGNTLPDPWTGDAGQPVMPWRGRITAARGHDGTAAAAADVAAFFGAAARQDFRTEEGQVLYDGPAEWGYRRFILHYAHLCAMAGGIDAFLIGSEMVGLTQIRDAAGGYPAVTALRALAADVRAILGPRVKIGYAADWSEYFGHHPGGDELRFHLDPLWADRNIDFVGIDNYMPLSDWRDGETHLDAHWGRIDNPDYLRANVCGGEGFDWYYASQSDRNAQLRTPITDGAGEDWVWRYKDIRGWWSNRHYERVGGERAAEPTPWVPGSKPVWFTEYGCAALDKGTNQPNKFLDAMSSESALPYYSDGRRDDAIQQAYVRAVNEYWRDPANNPALAGGGRMVELTRAHVWCWDARPYPAFPGRADLWADGPAWSRGHWLNGRAGAVPLAAVVADLCASAGVRAYDVSGLSGLVRGYTLCGGETGRAALQPLMLAHGFDAVERDGVLSFRMRAGRIDAVIGLDDLARAEDLSGAESTRAPEAELVGRVRISHVEAGADYATATVEAMLPDAAGQVVSDSDLPMLMTRAEARSVAQRWLAEAGVARDTLRLALPPSHGALGPGDVLAVAAGTGAGQRWRIDRVERAGAMIVDAVRIDPGVYRPAPMRDDAPPQRRFQPPVPVWAQFLDLPLLHGDEAAQAPWLAVTAAPWPGSVTCWSSVQESGGYGVNTTLPVRSVMGVTLTPLPAARPGVWDRGPALRLRLAGGGLAGATPAAVMAGANLLAIGDGSPEGWELMQFAQAVPVGAGVWDVTLRLRGQAGTDALMPEVWPAGSTVVLLDGGPRQIALSPEARGQMRYFRIGPTTRSLDDPSFVAAGHAFSGAGLRPLSPCHLRQTGRRFAWTRRTRVGGDGWDGPDVPLGESSERYAVRLMRGGNVLWQSLTAAPAVEIEPAAWDAACAGGAFEFQVAQLSDLFGAGPYARRMIHV